MVPTFKCIDIGMNCSFETEAETANELLKKVADHAARAHNMIKISPDFKLKIKKVIRH